jgi:hypothetical protein
VGSTSDELRRRLDLFTNIRLPRCGRDINLVSFARNTESFYVDPSIHQGPGEFMPTPDIAVAVRKVTRKAPSALSRRSALRRPPSQGHGRSQGQPAALVSLFFDCPGAWRRDMPTSTAGSAIGRDRATLIFQAARGDLITYEGAQRDLLCSRDAGFQPLRGLSG